MRYTLVALAYRSGQSLAELMEWHPRDLATLADILDDEDRARRRAAG